MTKLQLTRTMFLDLRDMADVLMNITHTKGHCMVCSSLSLEHNPYCPVVRWYSDCLQNVVVSGVKYDS